MGDHHGRPKQIQDFSKVIDAYSSHFNDSYDDQTKVTEEERKKRQEAAAQVADTYYDFSSAAYEANWSTHFHYAPFPPAYPPSDSTMATAMQFYEHRLAFLTALRPGMKVLDVGCGIGGPARAIAKFVGCEIVGITINQRQVDRAIYLTEMEGLGHKCTFVRGNFLDMPFTHESFDAAYAIEATCHSESLLRIYKEVARVLKPGAPFGFSEWVMTPEFDPASEKHVAMRNRLERGNGLVRMHTSDEARAAFREAGFHLDYEENFADHCDYTKHLTATNHKKSPSAPSMSSRHSQVQVPFRTGPLPAPAPSVPFPNPLPSLPTIYRPWTFPLKGQHALATTWTDWWTCWKLSMTARRLCHAYIWVGQKVGIVDKGVMPAYKTIAVCVDSVVEGSDEGIFSPCWWFIGRKKGVGQLDGSAIRNQ